MNVNAALVEHPQVDKIAFTGSGPVASRIKAAGAKDIKRISLELGDKSPFVVFADSDIEKAVERIMFGVFWNRGRSARPYRPCRCAGRDHRLGRPLRRFRQGLLGRANRLHRPSARQRGLVEEIFGPPVRVGRGGEPARARIERYELGVNELMRGAQMVAAATFLNLQAYMLAAVFYVVTVIALQLLSSLIEIRVLAKHRSSD